MPQCTSLWSGFQGSHWSKRELCLSTQLGACCAPDSVDVAFMAVLEKPVTPAEVSSSLRALIEELVPGGQPAYVDVAPLENASANDCFVHVPERVEVEGGSQILGWSLWELPGVFVEAEAHSVWLRPDGEYLDIAPKNSETARVFFLPDPSLRYQGRQFNNVRRAVVQNQFVQAYLDTFTDEFDLLNHGDRVGQFGEISLRGEEAAEYHAIQARRANAFLGVWPRLPELGPYLPCPCGSGKRMKWCHKGWE